MKSIDEILPLFNQMMKMLKDQFGENSEFVLHDWSKGYDHSIVAIENGSLTGRKIGDCGSNLGLEVIRGTKSDNMNTNYVTRTKDGRTFISSTMYIKNDESKPIGAFCVNTDITELLKIKEYYNTQFQPLQPRAESNEFFASDISELLNYLISEGIKSVDKPVSKMRKEDKKKVLRFLDSKGTFLINKAGVKVCEALDISKFTLYKYLDEIRDNSNKTD